MSTVHSRGSLYVPLYRCCGCACVRRCGQRSGNAAPSPATSLAASILSCTTSSHCKHYLTIYQQYAVLRSKFEVRQNLQWLQKCGRGGGRRGRARGGWRGAAKFGRLVRAVCALRHAVTCVVHRNALTAAPARELVAAAPRRCNNQQLTTTCISGTNLAPPAHVCLYQHRTRQPRESSTSEMIVSHRSMPQTVCCVVS